MEEKTSALIKRAYKCACEKGFHDKQLSVEHMLMLVVTEVSEAVEADRKNQRANLPAYFDEMKYGADQYDTDSRSPFEKYIKDSVSDELADACIRLYDMCGAFEIEPMVDYECDDMSEFYEIFGEDTFCEKMYYLTRMLVSTSGATSDDGTDECLPIVIGSALSFLFALAKSMGVDLELHILLKMQYNESREMKHGKKY